MNTLDSERIKDSFLLAINTTLTDISLPILNMKEFSSFFEDPKIRNFFLSWDAFKRQIIFIKSVGFVNYHIHSKEPGFWGIPVRIQRDFGIIAKGLKIPCWYVLLVGRNDKWIANGYIIDYEFGIPLIKIPDPKNDQYKINEKSNLDKNYLIHSVQRVAEKLIERGQKSFSNMQK